MTLNWFNLKRLFREPTLLKDRNGRRIRIGDTYCIFSHDKRPLGGYYNKDGTQAKYGEGKFVPKTDIVSWFVTKDSQGVNIPNASMVEIIN